MSEHRSPDSQRPLPETRDSKRRRVLMGLREKWCRTWPDCDCNQSLIFYQDKFLSGDSAEWTFTELAAIETKIFMTLRCVENRCPEPVIRRYATTQLLDPYWNRQWMGKELTDAE
jgi:hypothetical protein